MRLLMLSLAAVFATVATAPAYASCQIENIVEIPVLGSDFLRAHRVLIDNTTRKMVFTYEGGPVFQINNPAESGAPSGVAQPPHDTTPR